ncbi:RHS repeat protein [Streptomyces tricolor]|nr:RHS repeat protein [Streptomyces tricolor]
MSPRSATPPASPLRFTYDERGRVTSWTDTNGHAYTYAYDDRDRCMRAGRHRRAYEPAAVPTAKETRTPGCGPRRRSTARAPYAGTSSTTCTRSSPWWTRRGHTRRFTHDRFHRLLSETDAVRPVRRPAGTTPWGT